LIPGNFEYHRPDSIDAAVDLLGKFGDEGKVLAGGHSLVPMMKLRLAVPEHLIDIGGISDLKGIREDGGNIVIGAGTTQAELLASDLVRGKCPILTEAAALIADPQVRYCGTVGGNVANGDPGNDDPAIMMVLDATYVLRGKGGARESKARGFYKGTYDTDLGDDELLVEIRIPTPGANHGASYQKLKRKVGDYATAAAAVVLTIEGGACASASIALTNVGDCALDAADAAASLVGKAIDDAAAAEAGRLAMAITNPADDLRGPADFRKNMAAVMTRRAVLAAASRAGGA
jgi:carbon-monoxide dehydrogenase medium subunit